MFSQRRKRSPDYLKKAGTHYPCSRCVRHSRIIDSNMLFTVSTDTGTGNAFSAKHIKRGT